HAFLISLSTFRFGFCRLHPPMTCRALFLLLTLLCSVAADAAKTNSFDEATLSFPGTPLEQARSLLRPVLRYGELAAPLNPLPAPLENLIGQPINVSIPALQAYLKTHGIGETEIGGPLTNHCGAKYFVIHDTSTPNYGDSPIPTNINTAA